jgi:hypothetical protein
MREEGKRLGFYEILSPLGSGGMAVNLTPAPPLEFSSPEPVLEDTFYVPWNNHTHYDAMRDGRLIMLGGEGANAQSYINVVVNWIDEVEARVPR